MLNDDIASDLVRDAHADGCIECGAEGCKGCPSAFCDLPELVEHCREWMCPGCVAAFDRHIENKCDGTTCHCPSDGIPLALDEEETTPLPFESMTDVVFGGCRKMEAA